MMILGDYLDERWSCWLGQDAIAEMADVTERTVREFLAAAEQGGFLCRVRRTQKEAVGKGRGRGTDRLYLHVDDDRSGCPQCLGLPEETSAESGAGESSLTGTLEPDLPEVQDQNLHGTPLIPEPASEPATREGSLFTDNNGSSANGSREKDPNYGFDKFWTAYPPRKGHKLNKAKALAIWRKLTYDEKRDAWRGAKNLAVAAEVDDFYPVDAFRWLRDRSWPEWMEVAAKEPELDPLYDVR